VVPPRPDFKQSGVAQIKSQISMQPNAAVSVDCDVLSPRRKRLALFVAVLACLATHSFAQHVQEGYKN